MDVERCISCDKPITPGRSFCPSCSRTGHKIANTPGRVCLVCGEPCNTLVCAYCLHFERPCPECGEPFTPKRKNDKYCGPICAKQGTAKALLLGYARRRFPIFDRDHFTCIYCGQAPANTPGVILHVDHVIPCDAGGLTVAGNLVTACQDCNLSKADNLLIPKSQALILKAVRERNERAGLPDDLKIRLR